MLSRDNKSKQDSVFYQKKKKKQDDIKVSLGPMGIKIKFCCFFLERWRKGQILLSDKAKVRGETEKVRLLYWRR